MYHGTDGPYSQSAFKVSPGGHSHDGFNFASYMFSLGTGMSEAGICVGEESGWGP